MAQAPALDLCVDESFLAALFHEDEEQINVTFPFTDDEYAQRLQFQETLFSSLITSQISKNHSSSSLLLLPSPPPPPSSPSPSPSPSPSSSSSLLLLPSSSTSSSSLKIIQSCLAPETEHGKSSYETDESLQVMCEICAEIKGTAQMFKNQRCHHSFCSDCITKQVATKIQDSITVVSCPGLDCRGVLELDACRPWLPKELLDRWDQALCESLFLAAPKHYCPFRDCLAMLLVENEEEDLQSIREAECPFCHRLFCARCDVPWHPGVECEEFQRLNENERKREDLLVTELAKEKKWRRCPKCQFYVEKIDGCLHITCRCQYEFCYGCGEQWTSTHGGCQTN